ncbi:transposase domain-containing protein [Streptomyces sp. NBC_00286]|uniref:transposase domain-containing protein n=1 Tax=Streptomyces sp. NBC_00286 TaxID=2975701 RepID=UPI003FA75B0C
MPAPGRGPDRAFAAGHLGELTQIITPALVDEALELTRRVQRRIRELPARVTVYFVLALSLFGTDGYLGVWAALTAGLGGEDVAPSEAALRQARRRVGSAPLAILFDRLKGPAAKADCSRVWQRGCGRWPGTAPGCRSRTPRRPLDWSAGRSAVIGRVAIRPLSCRLRWSAVRGR